MVKKEKKLKDEIQDDVAESLFDDETVLKEEGKKKGRKPKEKLDVNEIAIKLDILFSGLSSLFKAEYKYKPNDYMEESRAIIRLNEKVPYISSAIMIFDPVIVVVGLYRKFATIMPKKKKPEPAEEKGVEQNAEPTNTRVW